MVFRSANFIIFDRTQIGHYLMKMSNPDGPSRDRDKSGRYVSQSFRVNCVFIVSFFWYALSEIVSLQK